MYIKKAEVEDIEKIIELVVEVARHDIFPGLTEEGQAYFLSVVANEVRVSVLGADYQSVKLVIDGQLLGFAAIKKGHYITKLFVAGCIQGCGIGRKLLDHLISEFVTSETLALKASPNAVAFYQANGFSIEGQEEEINGIRYIPMKRVLSEMTQRAG
ncbi:putative N-acetyltransferase YjaB [Vibrio aerogenes CECT 7868]|uniref:Putative N-acetyltransferase YjaB n=1 Tax=Vibrio aerogenes CECT 7868 TaxID=1216006 RepID=A0A1M6CDX5_9VIBR|nr:GNAT family N-acetyltransferase [Vibrio aerogenes]SHI58908.1 putative N-acetyltransferase YjaB [Vibrio aerogenes CECT 7868]